MATIDTGNIVNKHSYIFLGQASKEGQVFDAVRAELNNQQVPVNVGVQKMRSGGLFIGTREEVIALTNKAGYSTIYIITRAVGKFLYVSILTMAVYDYAKAEDVFRTETFVAYWNACQSCLEISLSNLGFEEYTKKYTGI